MVIGSVTTKELVLKDYAMEPDEAKLMRSVPPCDVLFMF